MNLTNPVDKRIGAQVRRRRLELDISVEHLASAMVVPALQITQWEAGVGRIGARHLLDIARILGVGPGFFFRDAKPPTLN